MKTFHLAVSLISLLALRAPAQTNSLAPLNLPTTLNYVLDPDVNCGLGDSSIHRTTLIAGWTGPGSVLNSLEIQNYPFIRTEWSVFIPDDPRSPYRNPIKKPLKPIRGRCEVLTVKTNYTAAGNPAAILRQYRWVNP